MQTLSSSMESQGLFLFPSVAEGCTIRGRGMARNPGISGAGLGRAGDSGVPDESKVQLRLPSTVVLTALPGELEVAPP